MCKMIMIESAAFDHFWECSNCLKRFKPSAKFEKNVNCTSCGKQVSEWIGIDDYEEED